MVEHVIIDLDIGVFKFVVRKCCLPISILALSFCGLHKPCENHGGFNEAHQNHFYHRTFEWVTCSDSIITRLGWNSFEKTQRDTKIEYNLSKLKSFIAKIAKKNIIFKPNIQIKRALKVQTTNRCKGMWIQEISENVFKRKKCSIPRPTIEQRAGWIL